MGFSTETSKIWCVEYFINQTGYSNLKNKIRRSLNHSTLSHNLLWELQHNSFNSTCVKVFKVVSGIVFYFTCLLLCGGIRWQALLHLPSSQSALLAYYFPDELRALQLVRKTCCQKISTVRICIFVCNLTHAGTMVLDRTDLLSQ
jgi:hypothetical protein